MTTTLSDSTRAFYRTNGYFGPTTPFTAEENARFALGAWTALGLDPAAPGPTSARLSAWHHQHRWAWDMATHPVILDQVEQLLGPDLVLWAVFCWYKAPWIGKAIPWHQDAAYWPIEPKLNLTVWVALAPTRRSNGCLRILPGTHLTAHEHSDVGDPDSWLERGVKGIDESNAVDLEMDPGQAVLFNEGALHGSRSNRSDQPRLACSMRYTTPEVRFSRAGWGADSDRIRTALVRGADRFHYNDGLRIGPPA